MIFDGTLSYLFNTGNNSGLIKNGINQVFMGECTILCRYKPDIEGMIKAMPEIGFLSTGIICKNGQHIGIFFKIIRNHIGDEPWVYRFSFEYWEKGKTEQTILDVDIDPKEIKDKWFDIEFLQTNTTFTFSVNGKAVTGKYLNLVDYSNSYLWVGCANRLAPDWKHELIGEIDKLAVDLDTIIPFKRNIFFEDYDAFNDLVLRNRDSKTVFLSNFKKFTYYKIHDDSGNGNHPIKYDKEWVE